MTSQGSGMNLGRSQRCLQVAGPSADPWSHQCKAEPGPGPLSVLRSPAGAAAAGAGHPDAERSAPGLSCRHRPRRLLQVRPRARCGSRLCSGFSAPHTAHARPGAGEDARDRMGDGMGDWWERNPGQQLGPGKARRKGTLAKVTGPGCSGGGGSAGRVGPGRSLTVEAAGFDDHGSGEMGKGQGQATSRRMVP